MIVLTWLDLTWLGWLDLLLGLRAPKILGRARARRPGRKLEARLCKMGQNEDFCRWLIYIIRDTFRNVPEVLFAFRVVRQYGYSETENWLLIPPGPRASRARSPTTKKPMFFCLRRGVFLSQFWAFSTYPYRRIHNNSSWTRAPLAWHKFQKILKRGWGEVSVIFQFNLFATKRISALLLLHNI